MRGSSELKWDMHPGVLRLRTSSGATSMGLWPASVQMLHELNALHYLKTETVFKAPQSIKQH